MPTQSYASSVRTPEQNLALQQQKEQLAQQRWANEQLRKEQEAAQAAQQPLFYDVPDYKWDQALRFVRAALKNDAAARGETLTTREAHAHANQIIGSVKSGALPLPNFGAPTGKTIMAAYNQTLRGSAPQQQSGSAGIPSLGVGGAAGAQQAIQPVPQVSPTYQAGGTTQYPSLGGGSYPAPGTIVGGVSYAGPMGGQAALDETKQIYGEIVPAQAGIYNQYAQETQAAEGQMQDMAQGYAQREQDLSQYLEGLGESELQEIKDRRQQLREQARQDMLARGITSTSAYDAAMRGIESTAADQIAQYQEALQRKKMDYLSVLSGEKLAAQGAAAEFGAGQSAQRFGAAQTPVQSMADLAKLLAEQRAEYSRLSLSGQDIGLGYAQLAESARQAAQDRLLAMQQGATQAGLGYSDLWTQSRISGQQALADQAIARINNPQMYISRHGMHL